MGGGWDGVGVVGLDEEEVGCGRRETEWGARVGRKRRWDGMGKKKVECKSARGRKVDCGSGKRRMKRVGARDEGEEGGISPFKGTVQWQLRWVKIGYQSIQYDKLSGRQVFFTLP